MVTNPFINILSDGKLVLKVQVSENLTNVISICNLEIDPDTHKIIFLIPKGFDKKTIKSIRKEVFKSLGKEASSWIDFKIIVRGLARSK